MVLLNREQLLIPEELKIEQVDLGGGEFVYVRQMTGRAYGQFEQSLVEEKRQKDGTIEYARAMEDFRAKLAVQTVCDENGKLIFKPSDYAQLSMSMSAPKLERIVNKAQELNRISPEDQEAMIKNSMGGQSEGSSSD